MLNKSIYCRVCITLDCKSQPNTTYCSARAFSCVKKKSHEYQKNLYQAHRCKVISYISTCSVNT